MSNIEETFRNYVSNLSNEQSFLHPSAAPPPSAFGTNPRIVMERPTRIVTESVSMGAKIWGIAKKWLGFVVFLIVAGVVGYFVWRYFNKKKPRISEYEREDNRYVSGEDLEQEYFDEENPEDPGMHDQLSIIDEEDEFGKAEEVAEEVKAFVEQEAQKKLVEQEEEEEDDFEKMKKAELKKLKNNQSTLQKHTVERPPIPSQNSTRPKNDMSYVKSAGAGDSDDDDDFDTLDNLQNA